MYARGQRNVMFTFSTLGRILLAVTAAVTYLAVESNLGRTDGVPPPLRVARATTTPAPAAKRADPPAMLVGDASLRGGLDLSRLVERDGRYEVPLAGGDRAVLTLDPTVQHAAESVLERAKAPYAAIVVMSTDGRLLAYAGRSNAEDLVRDFALPGAVWAPAASVFKVVTASALVRAGVSPTQRVCFHGGLRSVERSNLTDSRRDNACENLAYAVAKSQNAIIAKLTHGHLSKQALEAAATRFGFDQAPAFALSAETGHASIPADDLARARVAAGFWETELSPLGGALVANTVASGGLRVTPRIVSTVVMDGTEVPVVGVAPERVLREETAVAVAKMMVGTTDYGTARTAFKDRRGRPFLPNIAIAGKTGTLSRQTPSYLGYSWFVGFAPADEPQVVISVLLGNSPKWHLKAHTAARLVLDAVF